MRIVQIRTTNRASALALGIAAVVIGGVFFVFGLMLLLGLAAVGTLVGAGLVLYHRLTGRLPRFLHRRAQRSTSLHPELEVFSAEPRVRGELATDISDKQSADRN